MTRSPGGPGVAIVGCGLIGRKRAASLGAGRLLVCADLDRTRAEELSRSYGGRALSRWEDAVAADEVSLVIVATTHESLAEVATGAVTAGKHVLVEKPAGRSSSEITALIGAARNAGSKVRVGFNHRYHRAIRKARDLYTTGVLGEMMYVRARYGHGGRIGYETEWRADPQLSGGGELMDQGPHLIDLARWFLGDFTRVEGFAHTYHWDMPVDDNGFLLLRTATDRVAFLHASCTEWKNMFSLELYGRQAKVEVTGLGGSYGVERATLYKMLPEMGPPETTTWEYPMADDSWAAELCAFYEDIRVDRPPSPGLSDALEVIKIVERVYEDSGYDFRT